MQVLSQALAGIAVLGGAVVYGADMFAAIVLRSALSDVNEPWLAATMGRVHYYGDRRMPFPFVIGLTAAVLSSVTAASSGRTAAAVAAAVAATSLLIWLLVYLRISAPINRVLTAAALAGRVPSDVRGLQQRWDRALPIRFSLQFLALAALCTAIALPSP